MYNITNHIGTGSSLQNLQWWWHTNLN